MAEINALAIRESAMRLASGVQQLQKRYFLPQISIGTEPRIKVLRGFRGVGKTTALLQLMGSKAIYFSMDNPNAGMHGLYELGKKFALEGVSLLLIDEVHHYKNWKMDTKALYDEFPSLTIAVSGSSPLAFEPERRYEIIEVEPLSLREYAQLSGNQTSPSEAWLDIGSSLSFLAENPWLREAYSKYMEGGAFPLYFPYKEKTLGAIHNSIQKSIREDAVFLPRVDGEIITNMERTLAFLATAALGEFSVNSLSKTLGMPKNKAYYMVSLLISMKMLRLVRPAGRGAKLVRGEPKLMFYHPLMRKAVCAALKIEPDIGALREELACFFLSGRGWRISTIKGRKRNPDYFISKGPKQLIIEIGGQSKGTKQLQGFAQKTLLIDERQLMVLGLY